MLVPSYLSIISPIALFAVTLFTYNRLIADRELIIMRATGLSPLQLAKPVILIGTLFTIFGFYISMVLVPAAVTDFREMRWKIQHDVSHLLIQEGEFNDVVKGVTVYIRAKNGDGTLDGIILSDRHSPNSDILLLAKSGRIVYRDGVPQISMTEGSRQETSPKTNRFSILYFDTYEMDFFSSKEKKAERYKNPGERSMRELLTTPESALPSKKIYQRFRLEAFRRLSLPFFNLSLMLIAATGLLTGTFNRRGHAKRITMTILTMAAVEIANLNAENMTMRNVAFAPLLFIVSISPIPVCLYILKNAGTFDFAKIKSRAHFTLSFFRRFFEKCRRVFVK